MEMRICAILLAAIASSLQHASASGMTSGNDLLQNCGFAVRLADGEKISPEQEVQGVFCIGYLNGFTDSTAVSLPMGAKKNHCLPAQGIPNGQLVRIVTKHLRNSPEKLHESARSLVYVALAEAFPCRAPTR